MVPPLKLYYGDFAFWRAECIRLTFFVGGVPFEDVRNLRIDDIKASGKAPFGSVPVLEVGDEGKILSQTQAIANYASRLADMHPTDPWEMAKIDECLSGCTDVTGTLSGTFKLSPEEKISARKALIDPTTPGRLWLQLKALSDICAANAASDYSVGSGLTVADLAIWRLVGWVDSGNLDGVPSNFATETFLPLANLCKAVNDHAKVKEWKEKHPKSYK